MLLTIGTIVGIILAVVRLIESINQLSAQPEAKTLIAQAIQVLKNFFIDIEQYKK